MGYRTKLIEGLGWLGAFRASAKAIVFLKIILAYRYLSPRDVGLFGLATIALGLLEMMTETGINVIIIKEQRPLSYYLDTAFIVSVFRGLIIGAFLLLSSFVLPAFFRDPGLFTLLLWISLIPVIRGFINPAVAQYQKDLKFEKDALLKLVNIITDVTFSAILVLAFPSALSLVFGMLLSAICEVFISFLFIRPLPRIRFNSRVAADIINPGKWVNLAGLITYAEQNFDNVIVGRLLGSTALGFYQTAFNLTRSLIAEVGLTFSQVLLPIFGKIEADKARLQRAIKNVILPAALLMLLPIILLNFRPSQEFILLLLKEKWRPMIPLLPYLSIAAFFTGMNLLFNPVFFVRNQYKSMVSLYGTNLAVLLVLLLILIPAQGLPGAAKAVLLSRIILQPLFIYRIRAMSKGDNLLV